MTIRPAGSHIGPYTLGERLAVGGMSEVHLAVDASGRPVVLKLLDPRNVRDPAWRALLRSEAALATAAAHPNVVAVIECHGDDDEPFLAMEYVEGVDLASLIRALQQTQRRMEAPLACHAVRELLTGLGHIHRLNLDGVGLLHRDVSPSNVLLSVDGSVKLGDFGLAMTMRGSNPPGPAGTPAAAVAALRLQRGKVPYMAPEQLLGMAVDGRADLYAAGVVLAELLTGRQVFVTPPEAAALLSARDAQLEGLREVLSDHPARLVSVVFRALSRSPADRFQTAAEFIVALEPYAGDPVESRPLLAALVQWARTAARSVQPPPRRPSSEMHPNHSQTPISARSHYGESLEAERTREVPLLFYEVVSESGEPRGRFTFARLVEQAAVGRLTGRDLLLSPDGSSQRAEDWAELAPHLVVRSETTSEVAEAQADWADAMPTCTFLHALAKLVLADESGMLVAEASPARKEIYLFKGRPTHYTSNLPGESIGEYLVQRGLLNRGELDMALAMMSRFNSNLSTALVQLGLVDETLLAQRTDQLARERFTELFRWRRGTLRFFRGVLPPPGALPLTLEPSEVLRAGAAALEDPVAHFVHALDRNVKTGPAAPSTVLAITPLGAELMAGAESTPTLTRLIARTSQERRVTTVDALRELYFLVEVGALAVVDP
ncbi:MAG: serine/threonine protein kinase [Deltaproteobacteria bacterium]|nr:serine/threonine protein kinase [Deltaproteobacteria bacterium]